MSGKKRLGEIQLSALERYVKGDIPSFTNMEDALSHFRRTVPREYVSDDELSYYGIMFTVECGTEDPNDEEWMAYAYIDTGKIVPAGTSIGYIVCDEDILPDVPEAHRLRLFSNIAPCG